ncbi:sodium:glutamate symporter [Jonesiaceae bacterium BS-20]|uniref:Sodium:glutamate symporter n=1 Tax=Jonesiaceae bacterium BS-20 TaxID=3120821 RepID=A0AAU7DQC4_9MICO
MFNLGYSEAQWVGLAFVFLGIVLGLSWLIRRYIPVLSTLFIPSSVIAGFLMLLIGPQILGKFTNSAGLIPGEVIAVWAVLPGLLINIVFAALMLGKPLPSLKAIWGISAPHFIMGSVFSFGQFALGAFAVVVILTPIFGLSDMAGSILELSFAGGHGTIAGMGPLLAEAGAPEIVDLGLGLATISMVTGVIFGSILVRYGLKNPKITVARQTPPTSADVNRGPDPAVAPTDTVATEDTGLSAVTAAFMFIALAVGIAIMILEGLRLIFGSLGSDIFDNFPLFPFTVIGSFLVQFLASKFGLEKQIDRQSVSGIATFSLDALIASAIGTMSLAALGANIPVLAILTVIAVAWSVFGVLYLAPRIHREPWFEHGLADFGQSQGNVATGFILADMADPQQKTNAATAYGYKQLTYEPILGGGIITAFSVPLIMSWGSLVFGIIAAVCTLVLITWGILRNRKAVAA